MSIPAIAKALLDIERRKFHKGLIDAKVFTKDVGGVVSVADKDSRLSVDLAALIYGRVATEIKAVAKAPGQTSGAKFEDLCQGFLQQTFQKLGHLRPGSWHVEGAKGRSIAAFEQYQHLEHLENVTKGDADLAAALGTGYIIKPDVLIYRESEKDSVINIDNDAPIVDANVATHAVLRKCNNNKPILHASVSTKWTLRSDRAQNARTEALNLLRNRKGRVPHVVVVTAEPMPSRLASLALGTGDIDCVYHIFLPELTDALAQIVAESQAKGQDRGEDSQEMLDVMVRLCADAGMAADVVTRWTHTSIGGSIRALYLVPSWERQCAEMLRLQVAGRWSMGERVGERPARSG